jgi:pantoate--beta-alanine ligase
MDVIDQIPALRRAVGSAPGPLVLVPTMGALHAGHLALIARARELAGGSGTVAVSIFVNPAQFDRPEDLGQYPRTLDADLEACRRAGADLVFTPQADSIYAADQSLVVRETSLSRLLCGASRPGHFDGVCLVVLKLFHLFSPDHAVFGEKDFQQLAIIRRMVRDLNLAVEIVGHPTVREPDGLALSSRNSRLSPEQRADAPRIRQALRLAAELAASGERRAEPLIRAARSHLEASPLLHIDYLEIVDSSSLQRIDTLDRPATLATAVFYGEVRLIDHAELSPDP